jgi:hypothetical protein
MIKSTAPRLCLRYEHSSESCADRFVSVWCIPFFQSPRSLEGSKTGLFETAPTLNSSNFALILMKIRRATPGGWPARSCSRVFLGLTDTEWTAATRGRWQVAARDLGEWRERAKDVSRAQHAVPLRRHGAREIEADEGFRNKCARLNGGRYIGKDREPAGRWRYNGRANIPTLTIQRVGHPAAWVGPRASFRVVPMRCLESGAYRSFEDGRLAAVSVQVVDDI